MTANRNCSHKEQVVLARNLVPPASFILLALLVTRSVLWVQYSQQEEALAEANRLIQLAVSLCGKGNFLKAEHLLRRSLGIRKKVLGPEHPDVARPLSNFVILSEASKDFYAARPPHWSSK